MHLWTDQDQKEYITSHHAYYGQLLYSTVLTEHETDMLAQREQITQRAANSSSAVFTKAFPFFDEQCLSIWRQYRDAGLKPSTDILEYLFRFVRGYNLKHWPRSSWHEIWKIALQEGWVARESWVPVPSLSQLVWFLEHWFADQTFWQFLVRDLSVSTAAKIRQAFQVILLNLQQRNRPDMVLWFMTLKDQRGCQVIRRARHTFKFFFERGPSGNPHSWYDWYQQYIVLPQKSTVLVGAFGGATTSSSFYRAFSRGAFAERQVLRIIMKMAFE